MQTIDLTYDSHHPSILMGTLGVMIILWAVKLGIFAVYRAGVVCTGKGLRLHDKL
jgi:hypothetical protein